MHFAVYHETRMIAAGIGSWFWNTSEIPWAWSISDYKILYPNNMLYGKRYTLLSEMASVGLDFGRSTPSEGKYNFKKQWGAYWQYLMMVTT
jgi:hypothetical protein